MKKRLETLLNELNKGLIERDTQVRLVLLAALAGEHLLLIGPPGTAKSLISQRLHIVFKEGAYFERLLTKFSLPEELFGPLSIKKLQEDEYVRKTERYLPKASIAFIDEIFKANSAILNSLLTLLNERMFDNGPSRENVPLVCVIGASNELPKDGEEKEVLNALYDRFLLRCYVDYISNNSFNRLLDLDGNNKPEISQNDKLSDNDLRKIQAESESIRLTESIKKFLEKLRIFLAEKQIACSDRRWRKIVKLLKVSAFTNGRKEVNLLDCWLLQHVVWEQQEQRIEIEKWYQKNAFIEPNQQPEFLRQIVEQWEEKIFGDNSDEKNEMNASHSQENRFLAPPYNKRNTSIVSLAGKAPAVSAAKKNAFSPNASFGTSNSTSNNSQDIIYKKWKSGDRTNGGIGFTSKEIKIHFKEYYDNDYLQNYLNEPKNRFNSKNKSKLSWGNPIAQIEEINGHMKIVENAIKDFENYKQGIIPDVEGHLWIPNDFIDKARQYLDENHHNVEVLEIRMNKILSELHDRIEKISQIAENNNG